MRLGSRLILGAIAASLFLTAISPFISSKSDNPCAACHGNYYMYLDILEGDPANQLPTVLNESETLTVAVMVKVTCNAPNHNVMSSISATLASQNGFFNVPSPDYDIGSLANGQTAKATWQITAAAAGTDTLVITAQGRNVHYNTQFSDSYTPAPTIVVNKQSVNLPPSISITSPAPAQKLTGATDTVVGWTVTDEDRANCTVDLFYSTDDFKSSNETIATGVPAPQTYSWNLPPIDSTTVKVKATVVDPKGAFNETEMAGPFTIDSTPPSIISVEPADKSRNVPGSAILVVKFSEPVLEPTAQMAFDISPDPGGVAWSWNSEQTTMTAVHNAFAAGTTYTCTMAVGVKDLSTPGNAIAANYMWSFTTPAVIVPVPSISITVPAGGEKYYWGDEVTVRWTASGGTGDLGINLSISPNDIAGPFSTIDRGLPNTGSYTFKAPQMESDTCVLEAVVYDQNGKESIAASSDFAIARDLEISATFPPTDVPIVEGNSTLIAWNSTGGHGSVTLSLFFQPDANSTRQILALNLARSGDHRWTAPAINTDSARFIINATDDWARSLETSSGPLTVKTKTPPPPPPPPPPPAQNPDTPPIVVFNIKDGKAQEKALITFDASGSLDPQGLPMYYFWDFGDYSGVINTTTSSITHVFLAGGDYIVTLTVGDNRSKMSQAMSVHVESLPPQETFNDDDWELVTVGIVTVLLGSVGVVYALGSWPSNGKGEGPSEKQGGGKPPAVDTETENRSRPSSEGAPALPRDLSGTDSTRSSTGATPFQIEADLGQGVTKFNCYPDANSGAGQSIAGKARAGGKSPPLPAVAPVPPLIFDYGSCTGCGTCSKSCPTGAISMVGERPAGARSGGTEQRQGKWPVLDASKCTLCGICVDKCVKAAISSNPGYGSKGGI